MNQQIKNIFVKKLQSILVSYGGLNVHPSLLHEHAQKDQMFYEYWSKLIKGLLYPPSFESSKFCDICTNICPMVLGIDYVGVRSQKNTVTLFEVLCGQTAGGELSRNLSREEMDIWSNHWILYGLVVDFYTVAGDQFCFVRAKRKLQ